MNIEIKPSSSSHGPWALVTPEDRTWDVAVWSHKSVIFIARFKGGGSLTLQGDTERVIERFVHCAVALDLEIGHADMRAAIDAGVGALASLAGSEAAPCSTPPCGDPECRVSGSIDDVTLTFGSGELDTYGFWSKPCKTCAARYAQEHPGAPVWPPLEGDDR